MADRKAANDNDADRMERLIAANEAAANAMNRLAQVLERKEHKAQKAPRIRPAAKRPRASVSAEDAARAEAIATAQLARLGVKR